MLPLTKARAVRQTTLCHGPYQIQIKFTTVGVLGEDNSLRPTSSLRILVFTKRRTFAFGEHLVKKIHHLPPAAPATVQNCDCLDESA